MPLVKPTVRLPKLIFDGVPVSAPGPSPVPVRATTDGGTPEEVLVMFSVPVRVPVAVGVKITLVEQLAPAARVATQVLAESEKSPVKESASPVSDAAPEFEMEMLIGVLELPICTPPKVSNCALTCKLGAARPVPVKVTTREGTPAVVLAMVNVPLWLPTAVGAKSTCIEQLLPALSVVVHWFCVNWKGAVIV